MYRVTNTSSRNDHPPRGVSCNTLSRSSSPSPPVRRSGLHTPASNGNLAPSFFANQGYGRELRSFGYIVSAVLILAYVVGLKLSVMKNAKKILRCVLVLFYFFFQHIIDYHLNEEE